MSELTLTHDQYRVLEVIGNMKPAELRERVYTNEPDGVTRTYVKDHYDRGQLIARVFEDYLEGLTHINYRDEN